MADYYKDAEAAPEAPDPKMEEAASDSQTAELPKSILGGKEFKPGEEVVLQIVQVNEDSVIVRYATDEKEEEPPPAEAPPEASGAPAGGMSSMYE